MGQLTQEIVERPTRTFGANTEMNPKEECKAVLTRSQKRAQEEGEDETQYKAYSSKNIEALFVYFVKILRWVPTLIFYLFVGQV